MIKIIKEGTPPTRYQGGCQNCHTVFVADKSEVRTWDMIGAPFINCPVCNERTKVVLVSGELPTSLVPSIPIRLAIVDKPRGVEKVPGNILSILQYIRERLREAYRGVLDGSERTYLENINLTIGADVAIRNLGYHTKWEGVQGHGEEPLDDEE